MEKSTHGILIAMWVITRGFVSRKSHDIPKRYPQEIPIGSYRTYPYKKAPLKFDVQDLHRKDVKVGIDRGQLPVDALARWKPRAPVDPPVDPTKIAGWNRGDLN